MRAVVIGSVFALMPLSYTTGFAVTFSAPVSRCSSQLHVFPLGTNVGLPF